MWNKRKGLSARWPLTAGALLAAALAAAGCSSSASSSSANGSAQVGASSSSSQHVSLTLVSYMPLIGKTGASTLDGLLAGFKQAHPNISVTVQVPAATNGASITAVVQRDEAAGTTPDVVQSGLDMLRYLATGGLGAQNLNQVVSASALAGEWGGAHPYPAAVRALGNVSGQLYAIPWVLSTPVLFYNARLFTKAGLNPNNPPSTWAQVEADALAIKKATGADGLSSCAAGASSVEVDWCTQAVIRSNGGTVLTSSNALSWTDPKTEAAVQELGTLGKSGVMVNLSTPQAVQEFSAGKLAMVLNSSAAEAALAAGNGPAVQLMDTGLPSFGSAASVPVNSGSALAMLAKTPASQQAAWALIQYLTSDNAFTTITKQVGYLPLRTTLVGDPKYLPLGSAAQALAQPNLDQLSRLQAWQDYPGANFAQVEKLLENAVESVAFQGQPAAAALTSAQSQASALMGA
jgi:multiple sugar transport system substrate-binding protein